VKRSLAVAVLLLCPCQLSDPLQQSNKTYGLDFAAILPLLLQVTVSVIILVLFLLLESGPGENQPHFMPLLRVLLPWALHHRHAVRVPVQVRLRNGNSLMQTTW
jgi:hypothetical protein